MFGKKELIGVYSIAPPFVFSVVSGLLCAKMLWNIWVTVAALAAGIALFYLCCRQKYRLVKDSGVVSFRRCVVFDASFVAAAFLINWLYLYFPIPFSFDKFLTQCSENEIVVPVHLLVLILFLIPMIATNKNIKESIENEE